MGHAGATPVAGQKFAEVAARIVQWKGHVRCRARGDSREVCSVSRRTAFTGLLLAKPRQRFGHVCNDADLYCGIVIEGLEHSRVTNVQWLAGHERRLDGAIKCQRASNLSKRMHVVKADIQLLRR